MVAEAGQGVQWGKPLLCKPKDLGLVPQLLCKEPSMVVHTHSPSDREVELGNLWVH